MASPKKIHDLRTAHRRNEAHPDASALIPDVSDVPRFYFDLKFYPDGQGLIQYPLTQESASFRGLDERIIMEFIKTKLTPVPPEEKPVKTGGSKKTVAALQAARKSDIRVNLPFSSVRGAELVRKRSVEANVSWEKAEVAQSVFCYLKSLKTGQTTPLGACMLNVSPANAKNGTVQMVLPLLAPGLYRIMAREREMANGHADAGDGRVFQVI